MSQIRNFIDTNLLEPLKRYPTAIQDTLLYLIGDLLEQLYRYAVEFPDIINPNSSRLDILQAIADQFLFTVREEADIVEQVNILRNILETYNKRGSIDTIENMWKYYGGDLPKEVQVIIPSYKLFRYSISKLSGTHVFMDGVTNRTGVYEIKLINSNYPIPDLKEFLLKELVAAGNFIYFTNTLHSGLLESDSQSNPYNYLVHEDTYIDIQLEVLKSNQGFTWSGHNTLSKKSEDSAWSGRGSIFLELTHLIDLPLVLLDHYDPISLLVEMIPTISEVHYDMIPRLVEKSLILESYLYYTPTISSTIITRDVYNKQGELVTSRYPGYFILAESLLGSELYS